MSRLNGRVDLDEEERVASNRAAWNATSYEAWVVRYGTPAAEARVLRRDPDHKLRRLLPFLGDLSGLTVANPLGSHGRTAVAMALKGARVTVFDLSSSNERYARELASAASVPLEFHCGDLLSLDLSGFSFDLVVMELGIVHWFTDLDRFVRRVVALAAIGGRVVLQDFHPAKSKAGAYFDEGIKVVPVPPAEILEDDSLPTTMIRRWMLGEVVTAFARAGLLIEELVEAPMGIEAPMPEIYTLVGKRLAV